MVTEKSEEKQEQKTRKKAAKKKEEPGQDAKPAELKEERTEKLAEAPLKTEKPERKQKPKKKKSGSSIVTRGKRKKAIARASIKAGKGKVRINKSSVNSINNKYVKELILEPVMLAGEKALKVDVSVHVFGGGVLGQAQACRTAIARAFVDFFEDEGLKGIYLERDRSLLVEDSRRTESKKYKGPKARARYQKSYR